MSKNTRVFPSLPVATTEQQLVSHPGLNVVTAFVDALGFRGLCEDRLGQFVPSVARHRPGTILGSLAVMLAGGGEHVSDLDILRTGAGIFGNVPSNATVSRFFERTVTSPDLFSYGFDTLMRELRSRAWEAAGDRNPALTATALNPLIVDLDATLVTSHSDKEQARGTYKGGYGFAPFIASVDYGTGNGGRGGPGRADASWQCRGQQRRGPYQGLQPGHRPAPGRVLRRAGGRLERKSWFGPTARGVPKIPALPLIPRRAIQCLLPRPGDEGPHGPLD
jgi:hypothetical protein